MKIAITDANIFIDLFYLDSHFHLFDIGYKIQTTLHVIQELEDQHIEELEKLSASGQLTVISMMETDREQFNAFRVKNRGLSESDLSVLVTALRSGAIVLSGDDKVRKTCHQNKIEIHGILWCIEKFVQNTLISTNDACEMLKKLINFNKRLPIDICRDYIDKWS